jgi:hypothetical protein
MRPEALSFVVATIYLTSACGAAPSPRRDREQELRRAFQEIQVREAELEKHRAKLLDPEEKCERACAELDGLCAKSRSICAIAQRVMDRDALARCQVSKHSCLAETRRMSRRCECAERPGGAGENEGANLGNSEETGRRDE